MKDLALDPFTSSIMVIHVISAVIWSGMQFILYFSFHAACASGYDDLLRFLQSSYKRLILFSVGAGILTLVLGIVLAELLLGLEAAFDFTNIRIWPLHLGGVFGLATILIMIGGLTPNGNELSAVVNNLLRERSGDAQKKVNSLSHLIQTLSLVGVTFALLSVGLMAFARTVY